MGSGLSGQSEMIPASLSYQYTLRGNPGCGLGPLPWPSTPSSCQLLSSSLWVYISGADKLKSAMAKGKQKRKDSGRYGFKVGHRVKKGRASEVSGSIPKSLSIVAGLIGSHPCFFNDSSASSNASKLNFG